MNLIGDVKGKVAVLVDDMIDTAGTITNAAKVLRAEGAREVSEPPGARGSSFLCSPVLLEMGTARHRSSPLGCADLAGAQVYACASHAVFSPPAVERLSSGVFEEVIVTNTIPVQPVSGPALAFLTCLVVRRTRTRSAQLILARLCPQDQVFPELTILSVANLLGETIWRVYNASSVQALRD